MHLKVIRGKTIRLPAEFFSGEEPEDPATARVKVVNPKGVVVVTDGVPVRDGKGLYRYNYPVPADAPLGTWAAVWTATIGGNRVSASDPFEVVLPGGVPSAPPVAPVSPQAPPSSVTSGLQQEPAPVGAPSPSAEAPSPSAAKPVDKPGPVPAKGAKVDKMPGPGAGLTEKRREASTRKPEKAGTTDGKNLDSALPKERRPAKRSQPVGSSDSRSRLSPAKTLLIVAALGVILLAIWFSPRKQDTVQAKIDQGVAAQKAGRTDEARKLYREVLSNDPDNKLANFNLGVAAQLEGRMEDAESYYLKSLKSDPDFLPALFNLAILHDKLDRNEESAETYRRILEKYPSSAPAHLNYGFLLVQKMNQSEEGKAHFAKAVELDPTLAPRIPPELRPASPPADSPPEP